MSTAFDIWWRMEGQWNAGANRNRNVSGLVVGDQASESNMMVIPQSPDPKDIARDAFAAGQRAVVKRDNRLDHLVALAAGIAAGIPDGAGPAETTGIASVAADLLAELEHQLERDDKNRSAPPPLDDPPTTMADWPSWRG